MEGVPQDLIQDRLQVKFKERRAQLQEEISKFKELTKGVNRAQFEELKDENHFVRLFLKYTQNMQQSAGLDLTTEMPPPQEVSKPEPPSAREEKKEDEVKPIPKPDPSSIQPEPSTADKVKSAEAAIESKLAALDKKL